MNENQNEYVDINAHDNYPDSEQTIEIPTMKVIPLKKICMTIGELPTSYLETMTYYEMLIWFIEYLKNNIIPTINNNSEAIQEVQAVVLALQNYINDYKDSIDSDVEELEEYMNNYFENLDVQEEINNKLDDMLEDGVLEQIIEQFLQLTSLICFDNVADMKSSVNLANGSYAKTLGYHTKNDGGMATYKIRTKQNSETTDEKFLIQLNDNNLVAELIIDSPLKPEQIGAYGDGVHDDTQIIQYAINNVNDILMEKTYLITEIVINKSDLKLNFNTINGSIKIDATQLIQFLDIKGKRLTNESGIGLSLLSHTNYGIQYCNFSINLIRANECIKFNSSDGGWINQNYFYKTNLSYGTGITSVALTGNNTYNGNSFIEFGFEDITKWFNMNSFIETLFEKCRMIPFEADGQGTSVRELAILNNCINITFNNKSAGTYYEFITFTNSTGIRIIGKAMQNDGVANGKYMKLRTNGVIDYIEFDMPIFMKNMSDLTGTTIIEIYNYDVSKPLIFNYDTSKYTYVNLRIPDAIANALKYVDIVIIGTMGNSMTVTRNNATLREIPANTSDTTIRLYY